MAQHHCFSDVVLMHGYVPAVKRLFQCTGWSQQGSEVRNTSLNPLSPCCNVSGFSSLYDMNWSLPVWPVIHIHLLLRSREPSRSSSLASHRFSALFWEKELVPVSVQPWMGFSSSVMFTGYYAIEPAFPERQQIHSSAELLCFLKWMHSGILLKGRRQMTQAKRNLIQYNRNFILFLY